MNMDQQAVTNDVANVTEAATFPSIAEQVYPENGGELFFGFVSPVGTDEQRVVDEFRKQLCARGYCG